MYAFTCVLITCMLHSRMHMLPGEFGSMIQNFFGIFLKYKKYNLQKNVSNSRGKAPTPSLSFFLSENLKDYKI